ncbi:MAG: VanW family protein, partial [Chloroflexota bacterium]|nr:VanW family protein [Chloroflexota bacterium]
SSTEHAAATKAMIEQALAGPLVLTLGDQQWAISPEQLAAAVRVEPDEAGSLVATLDPERVNGMVAGIAKDVDVESTDAWVQDLGTHQWLVPAKQGRTLDRKELSQELASVFTQGARMIALVVTEDTPPRITTEKLMADLGITDLLATGDSVFAGSGAGRAQNVTQAAYMIDGTLVPPGDVFSFNDAVGSLFSGEFTDAGSYIDGPSGQSLAGGVCQVSTTVYRAALEAGLPIVEWWPHSYRSPFYETGGWSPGYDASIVQDGNVPEASTDFRFENATGSWLLVRAVASDDGNLRVELHGSDPGYTVEFDETIVELIEQAPTSVDIVSDPALPPGTVLPDQPAMDGLRVTVVRHVYNASGQEISTDTFVSAYRAYGAIRRVSPDME